MQRSRCGFAVLWDERDFEDGDLEDVLWPGTKEVRRRRLDGHPCPLPMLTPDQQTTAMYGPYMTRFRRTSGDLQSSLPALTMRTPLRPGRHLVFIARGIKQGECVTWIRISPLQALQRRGQPIARRYGAVRSGRRGVGDREAGERDEARLRRQRTVSRRLLSRAHHCLAKGRLRPPLFYVRLAEPS